jgi:hypothetical protein
MEELKVGTVTWYDSASGAFIEDLGEQEPATQSAMPTESQVFVPSELLRNLFLRTGELVRYTEVNKIATHVEPIMPSKGAKSYRSRF